MANGFISILARLSLILTMASSCLTVMGMASLLSPSSSSSLLEFLISTYLFFSFSAAFSSNRGPQRDLKLVQISKVSSAAKKDKIVCSQPAVSDVLLHKVEGELSLHGVVGRSVHVNLHHVFSEGNVSVLVMFVLDDEDCVEPNKRE